jgi:hypothetical protein
MTKSAEVGFEFGNHHRCDRKGSMDGPTVVLYGMRAWIKEGFGGALTHLFYISLSRFSCSAYFQLFS